jgi:hypothetical protein
MYYHRARYYAQSLRRFIQEDPVEGSTSPYAYVHGSPLEATDPSGMLDSYEMRMTDGDLAFKISISAASDARLNGLMSWGDESYDKYASAGGRYATVANGDGSTRQVACSDLNGACDQWQAEQCRRARPGCARGSLPIGGGQALGVETEIWLRGVNGMQNPPSDCGCDIMTMATYDPLTPAQASRIEKNGRILSATAGFVLGGLIGEAGIPNWPGSALGALVGYLTESRYAARAGDQITTYFSASYPSERDGSLYERESQYTIVRRVDGTTLRFGGSVPF